MEAIGVAILLFFQMIVLLMFSSAISKLKNSVDKLKGEASATEYSVKAVHKHLENLVNPGDFRSKVLKVIEELEDQGKKPTVVNIRKEMEADIRKMLTMLSISGHIKVEKARNTVIYNIVKD